MPENIEFIIESSENDATKKTAKNFHPQALIPAFIMFLLIVGAVLYGIKTFGGPKPQNIDFNEMLRDFETSPISLKEKYDGNNYIFYIFIENEQNDSNVYISNDQSDKMHYCKLYDSNGYRNPDIPVKFENFMIVRGLGKTYYYDPWYNIKTPNSNACDWFWEVSFEDDLSNQVYEGYLYKIKGKLSVSLLDVENFTNIEFSVDDCKIIEKI